MRSPMPARPNDTSREALEVQVRRWSALPPEAKARQVAELTAAANRLALAGLRERFPRASESELLLRLAAIRLGDDLARKAYGWSPGRDGA